MVTSLDLSDNQLTMLTSGSLVALRNVVRLKLDNNEIERILDGAFEQTPSLQNLHLSANNLTTVGKIKAKFIICDTAFFYRLFFTKLNCQHIKN